VKLHTLNYSRAIQEIARILHDVVLWELDREDLECQCICPSCSIGVCLCAVSSRTALSDAWAEAGPFAVDKGIYIHPPRKGSAAASAGLQSGDVVVAVDGREVESYSILQTAVRERKQGQKIQLRVQRGSDEYLDLAVIPP
jgi:C-terminal processing protease CtpA/Prc